MRAIDWVPGAVIAARYRLVRRVGEGGMGVIWAADDLVTGRRTALKRIKDAIDDPAARRRFLHEARAASVVRHPNVVEILDVLELEDGPPVLAMELLDGESLRDVLVRDRTLSVPALADIVVPVISAVGAAHALGVVHRDLKPENIFLARTAAGARVVKVLDFGIAKLTALDGEAMRSAGLTTTAVLGTPAYMAPEQVFGERDIDHRADIWALGVVVYECLAGVRPTEGDNVGQVLKHVVAKPFVPLAQRISDLPEAVSRLVERMLMRERSQRPADLHEVAAVLEPFASAPGAPFGAPAAHFARAGETAVADTALVELRPGEAEAPAPPRGRAAPGPPPGRWRPRRAILLGLGAALALMGLGLVRARRSSPEPPLPAPSPLADPTSKLACPILHASGVDEPAGWLGAAAAATACERARVILGGRPERTLVPAELLGFSRQRMDDYRGDPYALPDALDRSVRAARRTAEAYLDGEVARSPQGFRVALELRTPDAALLARFEGRGDGLYEAIRAAMTPFVQRKLIPQVSQLDDSIAGWSRTQDVGAALAHLDLTLAMAQTGGDLGDECTRFEPMTSRVGILGAAARWQCAHNLGNPEPAVELDTGDTSPEAVATRIRIRHIVYRAHDPGDPDRVHRLFEDVRTPWGKSLLAATESCLLQSSDLERAYELALTAAWQEPKNPDGQGCNPWEQLMTMAQLTGSAARATFAMQAWQPWSATGLVMQGRAAASPDAALPPLWRAYELTPLDTFVADTLADRLIAADRREDARGIALALLSGKYPVHKVESAAILVRIAASEARFHDALERARTIFDAPSEGSGWIRAQRFEVAWRALEVANILGDPAKLADHLVERFFEPDRPMLDPTDLGVLPRIAAVCTLASAPVSKRCFARLGALRDQLSGGITSGNDAFLRGVERYAKHDLPGAANAWRPLVRGDPTLISVLPDALLQAFEHEGDIELIAQVDEAAMNRAAEWHGATLAHVRAARRAAKHDDLDKARELATKVIDAWSVADQPVPWVGEMRRLHERTPAR